MELTKKEIEYLMELVSEAWFYNRSVEKLDELEQQGLYERLKRIQIEIEEAECGEY